MKTFEAIPGKPIPLGRLGENERLAVLFDVSAWLAEYPNAAIGLLNRLPNAEEAYPVILGYPTNGKVSWIITSAELSVKGDGHCELIATVGTVVAKSEFYRTVILDALDGSGEVPDQWETYQAQFTAIAGAAQAAQAGAEDAADLAEMWATGGSSGTPSANNNAKYWAEKAHGSSTDASTARNAAETAQGKAEDAQEAAETAQGKAEDAQEAAETAQGKAEDAQDAAETAQGKAEDAQDAAEDAADEAKMWATGGTSPSPASSTNNAHYWSTKAGEFANDASQSATKAEAWATGGSSGTPSETNNAEYWAGVAEQAAEDAQEIIDDTAGAGDTDKTWSADKIAGSIPDVSGKADKANTVLTTTLSRGRKANTTAGTGSFAFGNDTTASANYAHAEGDNTTASGTYAHAEGQNTIANKSTAHAEGQTTTAGGIGAHAEGAFTTANKTAAHAEGDNTTASGTASHAEGYKTEASGAYSSSRGSDSKASGQASDASGYHTEANHAYQHVFGAYNVPDDSSAAASAKGNYVEIVGNGTGSSAKSNARTLDWNGNERLKGDLYVGANADGTGGTKVAKITDIPDPTDIIDDEAGTGDTDKVFSADKVASELSDVKIAIDSLNAFCKKEITDVTEGSINVTSGTDVQKTNHIVTVNIASGTEYKFKLEANSRITKYHFYANETIVQYNCDPETTYTFTASSNISNVSIYCTGTQVVGTGSVKGIITISTETSNSLEERIETAESAIDSLEDQVDTIDKDLESLEVFCRKEITDVTKGSIDVTSGVDVQITEHLVDVSIASGTTYRFKIEASGRITMYHLYIDGTVLQYNCAPETVYTFTAESNITYFSIYCAGDVVVGTGSITGIVTIPTETTNSLEERLETVEEEIEEASSVSDAFIGAKILDMSDIRNSYVEGDIGEEIVFRPTTASKSIVNIIKVKEGLSYDIKVTYGSTISSSSTRGNYIVDDDDTVLQNFGMSATASTTVESQVTAVGDGYLILVVDSGYTGIEITGLIDANDIEAIDKKISGDSAEGILTDLIKARMITCITYFLWTNIHGEELLQNLCDSMGVDGWCDVRPKTGINSTTGLDEPAEVYRQASDFIDVTGTASIQSALSDTMQYPIFYAIRCYDSSKAFLGTAESDAGTTSSLNGNVKRNLVTDTKYIRFLFTPDPINSPTQNLAGVYTGRMLRMELTNSSNVTTTKKFTLREVEEFKDDL